jgi:hypothetical protein
MKRPRVVYRVNLVTGNYTAISGLKAIASTLRCKPRVLKQLRHYGTARLDDLRHLGRDA